MSLQRVIACLAKMAGYDAIESSSMDTLTELLESYFIEISMSSKTFSETSGRAQLMAVDVIMAVDQTGVSMKDLIQYVKKEKERKPIPLPKLQQEVPGNNNIKPLRVGFESDLRPRYVNEYYPHFPDPHTYLKTEANNFPTVDYKLLREKFAMENRNIETNLSKLLARTKESVNLFPKGEDEFLMVVNELQARPYLKALVPHGDDNLSDDDDDDDDQN